MIIYSENSPSSFGSADYKRLSNRKETNNRAKTVKRVTTRKKVKKAVKKTVKKTVKNKNKSKKLSPKNVKFLKSLGFRVKKR